MRINLKWIVAVLLILAMTGGAAAQAFQRTPIDWVIAKKLTVTGVSLFSGASTFSGAVTATDVTATGLLTAGNDLVVTDDLTTADLYNTRATTVTVTGGAFSLTPAGAYQPISSAAATGFGAIGGCNAANDGRLLTIVDGANQTITITETTGLKMAGNFAMGQWDAITYRCDGSFWIEIGRSNN